MQPLYPDIRPYAEHRIAVDPPHELYVEESGNPNGIPVLYVHGGPGSGVEPRNRCLFDPEQYRIILYDQRGAGRSTPHAELEGNDTMALVADMERIREALGIDRWLLFGGSWGSTLSLVYAQEHPGRVRGMILRGIFLCRQQDLDWLYQNGASRLFPDFWAEFVAHVPEAEHGDILGAYHRILTGSNELARMSAAKAWCLWEARIATLRPNHDVVEHLSEPHVALGMACIAAHYFVNQGFLAPNQILERMDRIRDIQAIVVHGRYDMVCPIDNAFALCADWPEAQLQIIRDAGHSLAEVGITDALVRATQSMARQLSA
jgi:proline iminopeptidase